MKRKLIMLFLFLLMVNVFNPIINEPGLLEDDQIEWESVYIEEEL